MIKTEKFYIFKTILVHNKTKKAKHYYLKKI